MSVANKMRAAFWAGVAGYAFARELLVPSANNRHQDNASREDCPACQSTLRWVKMRERASIRVLWFR